MRGEADAQRKTILAGSVWRQFYIQGFRSLAPINVLLRTQKLYALDGEILGRAGEAERMNGCRLVLRAGKADDIEVVSLASEAKIGCGIGCGVLVGGEAGLDLGGAFAVDRPGFRRIDGLSIAIEPRTHVEQDGAHFVGNGPIGAWADAEKKIAVLAHDVDELVNEELGCLETVVLHVTPGQVADGGIGLPVAGIDAGTQAAFKVQSIA